MGTRLGSVGHLLAGAFALLLLANLVACGQPPAPKGKAAPSAPIASGSPAGPSMTSYVVHLDMAAGRSIPAWGTSPRGVKVLRLSFPSKKGERRLIQGHVKAFQPHSTSDEILMATVLISCTNVAADYPSTATGTENIVKSTTISMVDAFVHVAAANETTTCMLVARGIRPSPASPDEDAESNIWQVLPGSELRANRAAAPWSRTVGSTAASRKLEAGQHWTPVVARQPVPQGADVRLMAQQSVTACTAAGGSRDTSTQGVNLCGVGSTINYTGSLVRVDLYARQLTPVGDAFCAEPVRVASQTRDIDRWKHHAVFNVSGSWRTSTSTACGRRVAYYATVTNVSGADAVIHAPRTLVTIWGWR